MNFCFQHCSNSESESESSADSAPITKKVSDKKPADKSNTSAVKLETKDHANSESDIENKATSNVVRKLTRSSSTRKSKHLTGMKRSLKPGICIQLTHNTFQLFSIQARHPIRIQKLTASVRCQRVQSSELQLLKENPKIQSQMPKTIRVRRRRLPPFPKNVVVQSMVVNLSAISVAV